MQLTFIQRLEFDQDLDFEDTMAVIEQCYHYQPSGFHNGELYNKAGSNEGSCKIFAFGLLNQLSVEQVLACFGRFYRDDVLKNPDADDHANIRNFMNTGWSGINFDAGALTARTT